MNKKYTTLICFVCCLVIFHIGCSSTPEIPENPDFFVPKDPPSAQYSLEARLEVSGSAARLEADGTIVFRNPTKQAMSAVALEWSYSKKTELEVSMDGDKLQQLYPSPARQSIFFYALPKSIKPGGQVELNIHCSLQFNPDDNGDIALQAWYPKLWWDDLPTRDSFRVKLSAPEGYVTATSGRLNSSTGFYENSGVTTRFGLVLSKQMMVEERSSEGVQVRALYTEAGKKCALLCLETAVDVIRFYKQTLGIFPFDSLTIVPGAARPMGGYPYASALVVIHGQQAFEKRPELHWKWITAHEIGHQYWGEYIMSGDTTDWYVESWLMIGMGIFADRMYVESRGLADDKHQSFFNRFIGGLEQHLDITADAPESLKSQQKYDRNNILIHGKGYSIVSALRSALGDATFKRIYFRCIHEFGGKRLGYRQLRTIAEEECGKNLNWFFEQWVRSPKYLCYQIVSTESRLDGEDFLTEIIIGPKGESILMPVDVKAVFKDGTSQTARVNRFSKQVKVTFRSDSELKEAVLDPLKRLAMLKEPLPVLPKELPSRVSSLNYNGDWEEGMELFKVAVEAEVRDYRIWFKLGMVIFEGGYFDEAFNCFQKILEIKTSTEFDFIAITWMGNIREAQGKREEALEFYRKALEIAPEGAMRHDQFGIQSSREWIEARLKAPFDWKTIVKR